MLLLLKTKRDRYDGSEHHDWKVNIIIIIYCMLKLAVSIRPIANSMHNVNTRTESTPPTRSVPPTLVPAKVNRTHLVLITAAVKMKEKINHEPEIIRISCTTSHHVHQVSQVQHFRKFTCQVLKCGFCVMPRVPCFATNLFILVELLSFHVKCKSPHATVNAERDSTTRI